MVLHKKSDFGFNGYRVPELPQGSRSIRKKRSDLRRNPDVDRLGAMDVLATVAGMLLGEKGKAPTLNSGDQKTYILKDIVETKPMKVDPCCRASCEAHGQTSSGSIVSHASDAARDGSDEAMVVDRGTAAINLRGPVEDGMDLDHKPPALASSDSSVDVISCRDQNLNSKKRAQHGGDDEDDSSGCTHPGPIVPEPLGKQNRRIRKVCSSKFWKVGPTLLKDGEFFSRDVDVKPPMFRSRKTCCKRQRTQRLQFKRRKLHDRSVDCIKMEGDGMSSFLTKPKMSVETEEYKVKLRIQSFKIPEVFIEMPENATVGSLKRTVLETVTAMLENGLRVGLILQGRKVRDDTRTLLQAGITRGGKLGTLGFTLEPTPSPAPLQLAPENPPPLLTCESPEPLARLPALPASETGVDSGNANPDAHKQPRACGIDGDQELTNPTRNSKALVPVTTASGDSSLSLVSQSGKPRRSEASRRIRRPFSVTEVEALVQAVEKLGTGRWRDVKLRAFDDAKHRTYVDLKDKWKTLVHTARISPQQRRGEPVPQELLDRVLAAHAYWSQHQAKLQAKPQPTPTQSQLKTEQCDLHL